MPHEAVMRNVAQFARGTLEHRPSRAGTPPVERWNAVGDSPVLRLRFVFCAAAEGALSQLSRFARKDWALAKRFLLTASSCGGYFFRTMTERATIAEICATPYGYGVFVQAVSKTFMFYVDRDRGIALQNAMAGFRSVRPLSHEFMVQVLDGLDCKIRNVVFYHVENGTFFTRITIDMKNELGVKIAEIDGRPSDTLALALRVGAPIFVEQKVLDAVDDVSETLRKFREK